MKLENLHKAALNEGWPTSLAIAGAAALAGLGGYKAIDAVGGKPNIANVAPEKSEKAEPVVKPEESQDAKQQGTKQKIKTPAKETNFDFEKFRKRLQTFEGSPSNKAYKIGRRGEIDIATGHAMYNPNNDDPTLRSRKIFNQLFGNKVDFDSVLRGRASLSDNQVAELDDYEIDLHLGRARSRIKKFDTFPESVKFAILDGIYRGDLGQKTADLINRGEWGKVAAEYLNHKGYRTAASRNMAGIVTRMNANAKAFKQYASHLRD